LLEKRRNEIDSAKINIEVISFSSIATLRFQARLKIFKISKYLLPALFFPSKKRYIDIDLIRRYPKLANRFRKLGVNIYLWTVNEKQDFELALSSGAVGVITDYPERGIPNG
jgi:glycerophosphoryl diester phosphodiesterase